MDANNALVLNLGFDWQALPRYLHFLPFFAITLRDVNNFLLVLYCSCNSLLSFHFYALIKRDSFLSKRWQKNLCFCYQSWSHRLSLKDFTFLLPLGCLVLMSIMNNSPCWYFFCSIFECKYRNWVPVANVFVSTSAKDFVIKPSTAHFIVECRFSDAFEASYASH